MARSNMELRIAPANTETSFTKSDNIMNALGGRVLAASLNSYLRRKRFRGDAIREKGLSLSGPKIRRKNFENLDKICRRVRSSLSLEEEMMILTAGLRRAHEVANV